jgi:hypothetical protein
MTQVAPAHQRVLAGSAATLEFTVYDQDGQPDTGANTVTVGVVAGDGSTVVAAGTATTAAAELRTYALTRAQTADVDRLTATWKVGSDTIGTTIVDVVGAHWFPLTRLRARKGLQNVADVDLIRARDSFADLADRVTGVAWVPRWHSQTLHHEGGCRIVADWPKVREIVAVTIEGTTQTLTDWEISASGSIIEAPLWIGRGHEVTVEFRHGYNLPPSDLVDAAIRACEWNLLGDASNVSPRAMGFSNEAGTFRYATADRKHPTGLPEVDAVLARYDHNALVI